MEILQWVLHSDDIFPEKKYFIHVIALQTHTYISIKQHSYNWKLQFLN